MRRWRVVLLSIIVILFSIISCDPTEIVLPSWKTEFLLPLIEADFDFQDITFSEKLKLEEDSSGALTIVYVSDKATLRLVDLISIPDHSIDFELPPIPNDLPDFQLETTLSVEELGIPMGINIDIPPVTIVSIGKGVDVSDQFIEAEFETGTMDLVIENELPIILEAGMIIEVRNIESGNLFISHTTQFDIPAFGIYSLPTPISLDDKIVESQLIIELRNIFSPGEDDVTLTNTNFIKTLISLSNLKLKTATMVLPAFNTGIQTQELTFTIPNGALLQHIELTAGDLLINMDDGYNLPVELGLSVPAINFQNGMLQQKLNLSQSNQTHVDLVNSAIDLTNNGVVSHNLLMIEIELKSAGTLEPVFVDFKRKFNGTFLLDNFRPHAIYGYLGTYHSILNGDLQVDLFDRVVGGSISFNNPIVIATIENELGVSITMGNDETVYIRATNPTLSSDLAVDIGEILRSSKINAALVAGTMATSQIELNGNNESGFEAFISILPTAIEYQFPFMVGTTMIDYNQFVIDSSKVTSQLQVEIPLDLEAMDLTIADTLDFNLELDTTYTNIVKGVLSSKVENVFPLEFSFQGYFVDSTYQIIDSLFVQKRIISPGKVNGDGKVINPFEIQFGIELSEIRMNNLQKTQFIIPVFVMNTFNQERVKLFSDSRIVWKLNADLQVILTSTP